MNDILLGDWSVSGRGERMGGVQVVNLGVGCDEGMGLGLPFFCVSCAVFGQGAR